MQWLKHAFAIDPPGPATPTAEQRAAVELLCGEVVRRRMVTPALMFLEMVRPLNFVGAQALHFFMPFLSVLSAGPRGQASIDVPRRLAEFLEHRGSIDYITARLEELEAAAASAGKAALARERRPHDLPQSDQVIDVPRATDGPSA